MMKMLVILFFPTAKIVQCARKHNVNDLFFSLKQKTVLVEVHRTFSLNTSLKVTVLSVFMRKMLMEKGCRVEY